eukprot:TRINITY_DN1594_c0_g1_i1.p2 TRINITY_DN1594_c0_g1~~TRINITY_DN1594_c0_g1_i1.p2  ORF type:complete len:118 (-),score=22.84 TRINITY_DN1594_c0_g1_i1:283-636(-)
MSDHKNVKIINSVGEWQAALKEAQEQGKPVIVDFSAVWCGPCNLIAPKYEQFSVDYDDVVFLKVDVDQVGEVASQCGISAMPTFQVFVNGEKVDEVVGAAEEKLKALILKYSSKESS